MAIRDATILNKLEQELGLKQLQINSLLTITQSINNNASAIELYDMYKSFLSWEMGVKRMALFIRESDKWSRKSDFNYDEDKEKDLVKELDQYRRLYTVKEKDPISLRQFDLIIPVFHKETPIAYALIGGMKEQEDIYNKIQFITTITNIIAVAIENKRLFKEMIDREKLKKEMELASSVQQMLIPDSLPQKEEYQLGSIYMPHFKVGGDYFDYIEFDKDKFAFCIADISGKGVSAALLMANFQAIIQSLIHQYRDLETFVVALNEAVLRITKGERFITFVIAEADLRKRQVKYVNCGHFPPFVFDGEQVVRMTKGTTILGMFDKLEHVEEGIISYKEKAMVMLFTDGLVDLRNENEDFYNEEMIEQFILKHSLKSVDKYHETLMEELETFKGKKEFPDDIAILTCRINHRQ